jgi:amino acid transporter
LAGLPTFGVRGDVWLLGFTTAVIAFFTFVNYRGASETGTVGNVVTLAKVFILGVFVIFGLIALHRSPIGPTGSPMVSCQMA